jgi:hypothetical protein
MVINSTTDIVNALVSKGVLTEEEGALLTKGRTDEAAGQAKALKKASKLTVSDALDNATIYGNMRLREEVRTGSGNTTATQTADVKRTRTRGKFELGVSTTAGNWYSDIALSTGSDASARSDNFTFGGASGAASGAAAAGTMNGFNPKESIFLKRAMLGWKATNWLTLEGGRMKNPLYTTQMMWDADYTVSGLNEKFNYKMGATDLFATLGQWAHYKMDRTTTDNYSSGSIASAGATTGEIYAFQAGFKTPLVENKASAKAALTYYVYGSENGRGTFGVTTVVSPVTMLSNSATLSNQYGVNNLNVFEVPAELNYMLTDNIGMRVYGDYAINTDADARAAKAGFTSNVDDTAWMLGLVVASAKDLASFEASKAKKGDWQGNLWYQEIGLFAVDPSLGDSDIFDSRLNMKGVTFKGQYLVEDNVSVNLTASHGTRLNSTYNTPYSAGADLSGLNLNKFDLVQMDLTYKF